jgi:hypothetical protein
MSNLVLLNQVQMPGGPVAPGSVFPPSEVDRAYAVQAEGGVLTTDAALGAALATATKMRLRGVPWEDIEAFLMGFAGDDMRDRVAGSGGKITCTKPFHPPTIVVPCLGVRCYAHDMGDPGDRRLLMRGVRLPGLVLWAGEWLTDPDTKQTAFDAGCEIIRPEWLTGSDPASVFADETQRLRSVGALTWEENEVRAARARLAWTQAKCIETTPDCPPGYFSRNRRNHCCSGPYSPA